MGKQLIDLGQFARVVKGVDLRSTAGNCAWAQTPQLTYLTEQSPAVLVADDDCLGPLMPVSVLALSSVGIGYLEDISAIKYLRQNSPLSRL